MRSTYSDLSHDFVFAKLHGAWAKAVAGARLAALVDAQGESALARILADMGIDSGDRASVQKALTGNLINVLAAVRHLLDRASGEFYGCLIDRFYVENLKTILHYRYFPEREVDLDFLLISSEHLPSLDVEAMVGAPSVHRFYEGLPRHDMRTDLLPILVELDDTRDVFVAEGRIDKVYYAGLLAHAARLPRRVRLPATELLQMEVDIANLVMLLRSVSLYRLTADVLESLVIPGGLHLPDKALGRLAEADSREDIVPGLPAPYASLLKPLAAEELYTWENTLWNALFDRAHAMFRDYSRPAASVAAFPVLKRFEALNIGRAFEGFRFGLGTGAIRSMLIGIGHA